MLAVGWGMACVMKLPVLDGPVFIILLSPGSEFGFVV